MSRTNKRENGAVSLFIVIFSALLVTMITVAFVRIMAHNQQLATSNDLSKSALDSAFAGVEDAKRAIITYRTHCLSATGSLINTTECTNLDSALRAGNCTTIQDARIAGSVGDSEVLIRQNEGDEQLRQAYTCVKVELNTADYVGVLNTNDSRMIPLRAGGEFNQVVVEWFSQSDLQTAEDEGSPATVDLGLDTLLPKLADWPKNRPSMMRAQLIQFGDSFRLSDFNDNDGAKTNNATLFLMPSTVGRNSMSFGEDIRRSQSSGVLQQVRCDPTFSTTTADSQFACRVTITLPEPIGPDDPGSRTAYLMLEAIYAPDTTFKVSMLDEDDEVVTFSSVQPSVDSTGRANDMFRRVVSRVELEASSIPSVEATVDITGGLCKSFLVTDEETDYTPSSCGD